MKKTDWNKFTVKYPKAVCFGASVPKTLPKTMRLDKQGKNLPTPFKLLCEWVETLVIGEWTAHSRLQLIKVVCAEDVNSIRLNCKASIINKNTLSSCSTSYSLKYKDTDYIKVANKIGYCL